MLGTHCVPLKEQNASCWCISAVSAGSLLGLRTGLKTWSYVIICDKTCFNSDIRLIGIFGEKNFWKKNLEIFLFNDWNFQSQPIRRESMSDFRSENFLTSHNVYFDVPKYLFPEMMFNRIPIEIYTPWCMIFSCIQL